MPQLFISHSSKDDLAAEAVRRHLVERGWNRKEIFLDLSAEGISAHEKWKNSLAEANSAANALLCLASPDWLASKESQVERRVAETLAQLNPQRSRAVLVAILRDLKRDQLLAEGFGEHQIVDLSAAGDSMLVRADLPGRPGEPGRHDDVKFNAQALEKIERSLRLIGIAPGSFEWTPGDAKRSSPYPGLEAFSENDAGVFFGRESRLADALGTIDSLRRTDGSRILTIMAASGVGKSSFLRAGLWPRLARQSGLAPLVILRPGAGIISGREGGLIFALSDWFGRAGRSISPGDLRAHFADCSTREGLTSLLAKASDAAGKERMLIIAIDQAEELFDTSDEIRATEAGELFEALLALVVAAPPAGVNLLTILTIRADAYDSLATALARALDAAERSAAANPSALKETSLTLPPLPVTVYREIIRRPAQVARKTEGDVFEPALIDHLLDSFTGADALPLLAKTLEQVYAEYASRQHITRADYEALYGARAGAEAPVKWALDEAFRIAGSAGTEENLKRLLIPGLLTWDPAVGEAGAARRRIATRKSLLHDDPDLTRLADALASERVRLLTRGNAKTRPTLEVAHETLLRIQPVRRWIEEFSVELRLRDEIEREASEWQEAETKLAKAQGVGAAEQLETLQRDIETAVAARRGPRLEAATRLVGNPIFARLLGHKERTYLEACQARETEQINRQRRVVGRAFVKPALQALEEGLADEALRLVAAGALLANDLEMTLVPELRGPAGRAIFVRRVHAVLKGHTSHVVSAAFSPDGKRVVTASVDQTARLWDVESGKEVAVLKGHTDDVWSAAFSPDGKRVVTASVDQTARLWDVESGNEIAVSKGHTNSVWSAAFSADGKRVVTASSDRSARLWDTESGAEIAALKGHTDDVWRAAFSPDGKRVVTASSDESARLWDVESGKEVAVLKGHTDDVVSAAFSADGKRVVTASSDETARLWDMDSGNELAVLKGHTDDVWSAVFSPDGKCVVTASSDKTARLWDVESGKEIAVLKGHTDDVVSAAFSADGKCVVTTSLDQTARLWDTERGKEVAVLKGHSNSVWSAAFSADGKCVVTASRDQTARLWGAESRNELAVLKGHTDEVVSAAFSPDGMRVVTASSDETARLWDVESGSEIAVLKGHTDNVRRAAFSADGKCVVTASLDQTARLWSAESGNELAVLKGHTDKVVSAAFSSDGKLVVTASVDQTARLWDAESGNEIALLKGHTDEVVSAAFSADGKRVVTASSDETARLWDTESGNELAVLKGHTHDVWSAAFSPDGECVVTASRDQTARLWGAESGNELAVLKGHTDEVVSAAFSADGKCVVTTSLDQTARLWDTESGKEIAALKGHTDDVWSAAFSADGKCVVTASRDQTARLWGAESGNEIAVLKGHTDNVWRAAFSADGKRVVTAPSDDTARLWDVSRSEVFCRNQRLALVASLAQGIGWRTADEQQDLLMQDAPDDMFSTSVALLGGQADDLAETVAALRAPRHPNCYLGPTDFATRFGLKLGTAYMVHGTRPLSRRE